MQTADGMRFLDPMAGPNELVYAPGGRADAETVAPLEVDFAAPYRGSAMGARPAARRAGLAAGRRRRSRVPPSRARGEARGSVREAQRGPRHGRSGPAACDERETGHRSQGGRRQVMLSYDFVI